MNSAPSPTIALILGSFLALCQSYAKEVALFEGKGRQASQYGEKMKSVDAGDTIRCGSHIYSVFRRIGSGETTMIFDIGDGLALRVPKWGGIYRDDVFYYQYTQAFHRGHRELQKLNLRTVTLVDELSLEESCLVMKKFVPRFSLQSILDWKVHGKEIQGVMGETILQLEAEIAYRELLKFLKTSWPLEFIGDLHSGNILWTTEGWIFADYSTPVIRAASANSRRTIVDGLRSGIAGPVNHELNSAILEERALRFFGGKPSSDANPALTPEDLRAQLPHFQKTYFLNQAPELLLTIGRETLQSIPRVWFVERILQPGGIENYFLKLPATLQTSVLQGLKV